jgi:hypothetical protein
MAGERVVWKFGCPGVTTLLALPEGAEFLSLQVQGKTPTLWFSVPAEVSADTSPPRIDRAAVVVGTGQPYPAEYEYLGTFQLDWFVGHVFMQPADEGEAA